MHFFLILVSIVFVGCKSAMGLCPYEVDAVSVRSVEHDGVSVPELCFDFTVSGDRAVRAFELVTDVYSSESDSGGDGSILVSPLVTLVEADLAAGESACFCIPLTPWLSDVHEEALYAEGFYIRRVYYADGGTWKDPYGIYAAD